MTAPTPMHADRDEPVLHSVGRPVIRFVAALSIVAAALGALWWTGLFAPRVHVTVARVDAARRVAVVVVRNDAPVAVEVERVAVSLSGGVVAPSRPGGTWRPLPHEIVGVADADLTLRASAERTFEVVVRCATDGGALGVEVDVRTPGGSRRTIGAGLGNVRSQLCPSPARAPAAP